MNEWTKRRGALGRRSLFIVVNLALLALLFWGFVAPIAAMFAEREARIQQQQALLARLSAIAAQASAIEGLASETESQLQNGEFLTGANENVIAADLQTKLKTIMGNAGAQSRAIQSLPGRTVDQIKYSGARIDLSGPLPAVMRAVHAVESARPYLFIANAVLKSAPAMRPGTAEEPVLQAQLDIYGAVQ
ncbi:MULTISPECIES: type II secretion system protein GspM [unclassified Bradyrhizobium]|uniref:type II secretion system protein GspM n=1 Tax=unclassified Bradyrhizobium TaxID=2631580 RepID=UPI0028E7DD03|nr:MULTISPECIES: type II secretion system protein GspM [unclassified Bradyrhizobium]